MQNAKEPQVIIERDFITVRDSLIEELRHELYKAVPPSVVPIDQKLEAVVEYDTFGPSISLEFVPSISLEFVKYWLFFRKKKVIVTVDFFPDVSTPNVIATTNEETNCRFVTKTGMLVAKCYNKDFEFIISEVLKGVSKKFNLSQPILKRKGYD